MHVGGRRGPAAGSRQATKMAEGQAGQRPAAGLAGRRRDERRAPASGLPPSPRSIEQAPPRPRGASEPAAERHGAAGEVEQAALAAAVEAVADVLDRAGPTRAARAARRSRLSSTSPLRMASAEPPLEPTPAPPARARSSARRRRSACSCWRRSSASRRLIAWIWRSRSWRSSLASLACARWFRARLRPRWPGC